MNYPKSKVDSIERNEILMCSFSPIHRCIPACPDRKVKGTLLDDRERVVGRERRQMRSMDLAKGW